MHICFNVLSCFPITKHIIFIHGTLFPLAGLFLSPVRFIKQQYNQSDLYPRLLARARMQSVSSRFRPMQGLGLQQIELGNVDLHTATAAKALAYIFKSLSADSCVTKYYTFGWSGELSIHARQRAGRSLLHALKRMKSSQDDTIQVIAHSHGGNVLAHALADEKNIDLAVDDAVLLATPVQDETKHYFNKKYFKRIMMLWSASDYVVPCDYISTSGQSARSFESGELDLIDGQILQIEVLLNQKKYFGHSDFFYFDMVDDPFYRLINKSASPLQLIHPLPLAALIPLIEKALPAFSGNANYVRCNLAETSNQLCLTFADKEGDRLQMLAPAAFTSVLHQMRSFEQAFSFKKEAGHYVEMARAAVAHRANQLSLTSAST